MTGEGVRFLWVCTHETHRELPLFPRHTRIHVHIYSKTNADTPTSKQAQICTRDMHTQLRALAWGGQVREAHNVPAFTSIPPTWGPGPPAQVVLALGPRKSQAEMAVAPTVAFGCHLVGTGDGGMTAQQLNISGCPCRSVIAFVSICVCLSLCLSLCSLLSLSVSVSPCSSVSSSMALHLSLSPYKLLPHRQSPRPLPSLSPGPPITPACASSVPCPRWHHPGISYHS